MNETDEIAANLLRKGGWQGQRQLSWGAARKIARLALPDESEVMRDNLAESLRNMSRPISAPTLVREFSRCGPCIVLGELVKRTAKTVTYRTSDGKRERRGGQYLALGLIHLEPCHSCRDHSQTQYPQGYMD